MCCQGDALVQRVCELYEKISSLESLKPSQDVNMLFTQLVLTCIPPSPIDVSKLCQGVQEIRSNLIRLCGEAEGLLENHFSTILGSYEHPLDHLDIFPYYSNYLKLTNLSSTSLANTSPVCPAKLPLWVLALFPLLQLSWPPITSPKPLLTTMTSTLWPTPWLSA